MKYKAVALGLALLIAVPAWAQRGGGHGGFSGGRGGRGTRGSSNGHAEAARLGSAGAHMGAPSMVAGSFSASAPRSSNSSLMGRVTFVAPPATPTRSTMPHVPVQARPSAPSRTTVTWGTTSAPPGATTRTARWTMGATPQHTVTAVSSTQGTVAAASTQPARQPGFTVTPSVVSGNPFFLGGKIFFNRPNVFLFFGDCFVSPFVFETATVGPFLVNPFCPFCATGRILKLNGTVVSPFVRRKFFFGRFFPSGFFPTFGPVFGTSVFFGGAPTPAGEEKPPETGMPAEEAPPPSPSAEQPPARPVTLLTLKNGSMYGLRDYWIEDGRLHYITTYGAQNSVPLEQIDFDKTVQLNAERGVEFVLRPKPRSH